ncbi:MAG: hypothetical protein JKY37_31590 [Nannocystaceae bacterium]|nr:hypothetical protein [Nannocystaceae bacterium]
MADIALVTEGRLEAPSEGDWYIDNVLTEDRLLAQALEVEGLSSERVDWARDTVDWSSYRAAVVRTTWDYFEKPDAFRAWVARASAATRLFNPPATILWNVDKRYLLELAAQGIAVAPMEILERGSRATIGEVMQNRGWHDVVLKPTVSGGGRHTYRVQRNTLGDHEVIAAKLLAEESMLLQPFLRDIVARGEVTVVVIDGEPTHALLKRARDGEFRVQDDHGGTLHEHQASEEELDLARRAIAVCSPTPLYGRVDMVRDEAGRPLVMELELIEPELWFRRHPPAATALARALAAALSR